MTEKLYWNDAYAKEFSARITKINGNEVVLDKNLILSNRRWSAKWYWKNHLQWKWV